jgi:hypothetical protein
MRFDHGNDYDRRSIKPVLSDERAIRPQPVSTYENIKQRIADGFAAALEWIRGKKHLSITEEPKTAEEARLALIREREALEKRKRDELAATESTRSALEQARKIKEQMDAALAAETARIEAETARKNAEYTKNESLAVEAVAKARDYLTAKTTEHTQAAREADKATKLSRSVAGEQREEKPISAAAKERRAKNLAKKGSELVPDAVWEAGAAKRSEKRKERLNANTRLLVDESSYPIPWKRETALLGERGLPPGSYASAVQPMAKHAQVVGAGGKWSSVDFSKADAWKAVAEMAELSTPRSKGAGRQVKHVAHGVLSKPLNEDGGVQKWSLPEANRAARHYLRSQGADPSRHDYVVVVHSDKTEEAIHVLWNRVRDDGMIHRNDNAWVSSALGRARWDQYAGIDPARISVSDSKEKPIREGFKKIRDDSLCAEYFSVDSEKTETVPLIGREHAAALGSEGSPDDGQCAGTWTPKPCYRTKDEVRSIFYHCLNEAKS